MAVDWINPHTSVWHLFGAVMLHCQEGKSKIDLRHLFDPCTAQAPADLHRHTPYQQGRRGQSMCRHAQADVTFRDVRPPLLPLPFPEFHYVTVRKCGRSG